MDPPGMRKLVFRRFMPTNALASEGKIPKNPRHVIYFTHHPARNILFLNSNGRS
jgi:hypothetical protein